MNGETARQSAAKPSLVPEKESQEQRASRLIGLIQKSHPTLIPDGSKQSVVSKLTSEEDKFRLLFSDPDFALSQGDLKRELLKDLAKDQLVHRESTELTALVDEVKGKEIKLDDNAGQIADQGDDLIEVQIKTAELTDEASGALDREKKVARDLTTLRQLDQRFDVLKDELGTIGALETLLEPGQLQSAEMIAIVRQILATARQLQDAIPGKSDQVAQLLNQAPLELTAATPGAMFGGFLDLVDKSPDLDTDEKIQLRAIILQDQAISTGRDLRQATKVMLVDRKTGERHPRYTRDHPLEVRRGVESYSNDQDRIILKLDHGSQQTARLDVTGWSDGQIGMVTEAFGFAKALQENGLGILADQILGDPLFVDAREISEAKVTKLRKLMSALIGGFEANDGDIFDASRRSGLLSYIAQLITPRQAKVQPQQGLTELKLIDEQGRLQFDQFQRLGTLARVTLGTQKRSFDDAKVLLAPENQSLQADK